MGEWIGFMVDEWCFVEARRPIFMQGKCIWKGLMEGGEKNLQKLGKMEPVSVGLSQPSPSQDLVGSSQPWVLSSQPTFFAWALCDAWN